MQLCRATAPPRGCGMRCAPGYLHRGGLGIHKKFPRMGLSRSENLLEKRDAGNSGGDVGLSPRVASSWEHVWLGWACAGPV